MLTARSVNFIMGRHVGGAANTEGNLLPAPLEKGNRTPVPRCGRRARQLCSLFIKNADGENVKEE